MPRVPALEPSRLQMDAKLLLALKRPLQLCAVPKLPIAEDLPVRWCSPASVGSNVLLLVGVEVPREELGHGMENDALNQPFLQERIDEDSARDNGA